MLYSSKYKESTTRFFRNAYCITIFLLTISISMSILGWYYYNGDSYKQHIIKTCSPEAPPPEVKERIKFIEKQDAIPTWKLIQHLNGRLNKETSKVIAIEVDKAHKKYGLPKKMIIAVMKKESDLNPLARSKNNKGQIIARGLMQVYAKYHKDKMEDISLEELYHIDINTDIGCQILREYYDQSDGDLTETFHKYLSKNASKSDAKRYMDEILKWWAVLEMYEYSKETNPKSKELETEEINIGEIH